MYCRRFRPEQYNVQVAASGFQTLTQERITVDALATIALDLTLKVGSADRTGDGGSGRARRFGPKM